MIMCIHINRSKWNWKAEKRQFTHTHTPTHPPTHRKQPGHLNDLFPETGSNSCTYFPLHCMKTHLLLIVQLIFYQVCMDAHIYVHVCVCCMHTETWNNYMSLTGHNSACFSFHIYIYIYIYIYVKTKAQVIFCIYIYMVCKI